MKAFRNILAALLATPVVLSYAAAEELAGDYHQFTFAWPYRNSDDMRPRGGTTRGPAVTLVKKPGAAWVALNEPGITDKERDRRAILAMAGGYRTSFDFLETVGFTPGFEADRPYQSWGTEYIYVVADEPEFISLQHIIVMFFESDDGEISEPAVVKHWRQDWRYEDRDLHVYVGNNTWERRKLRRRDVAGTWSQAVFQVDDSPRYQAIGKWQHHGNYSSWQSDNTWRPLPRREFSVRSDYHVLSGTNRHTITPTGWVQEEDNLKLVLGDDGAPRATEPYLSREIGLNRYERITGHDFSAGDMYWEKTGPFWTDVRDAWEAAFEERDQFTIRRRVNERPLFMAMFEYAGKLEGDETYNQDDGRAFIMQTFDEYLD